MGSAFEQVTDSALLRELNSPGPSGESITAGMGWEAVKKGATELLGLPGLIQEAARAGDITARKWIAERTGWDIGPGSEYDKFAQHIQEKFQLPTSRDIQEPLKMSGLMGAPEDQPQTSLQKEQSGAIEMGTSGLAGGPIGGAVGAVAGSIGQRQRQQGEGGVGADILAMVLGAGAAKGIGKAGTAMVSKGPEGSVLRAMTEEGVTPQLAGTVTGNKLLQIAQNALQRNIGSADRMKVAVKETVDQIDNAVHSATRAIAPKTGERIAGEGIQYGIDNWKSTRFAPGYRRTLDNIPITNDERFPVNNMFRYWDDLKASFGGQGGDIHLAKEFEDTRLARIIEAARKDTELDGRLRWETIKTIRTEIGQLASDTHLISNTTKGRLDGLYGALSQDLGDAASSHGPAALRAFQKSNEFYAAGRKVIDESLNRLYGARIPEVAYQLATQGNATDLWRLRATLPRKDWDTVVGTFMNDLGRTADKGPFDPNLFFRNWQKTDGEVKRALLSGGRYASARHHYDNIAKMSEGVTEASKLANYSNTAGATYFLGTLLAVGDSIREGDWEGAGSRGGLAILTPYLTARLLTNPHFVRWLATPASFANIPARTAALAAVAKNEPELSTALKAYTYELEARHPIDRPVQ